VAGEGGGRPACRERLPRLSTTRHIPEVVRGPGGRESDCAHRIVDATVRSWYGLTGFTHFLGDLQVAPVAVVLLGT